MRQPFHLAIAVYDLAKTRHFYGHIMGCTEGRSAPRWVDYDFFSHQLSAHLVDARVNDHQPTNTVDGKQVPLRHFGIVLPIAPWQRLVARLERHDYPWLIEPVTRFAGQVGEQHTFFIQDPSNNALEFKAFAHPNQVFAVG